jgi:hypothetical protein
MSKRLVLLACIVMIPGILSAPAVFADIIIMADESCRTSILKPDTNNHDSSKLSIRSDEKSAKSWIKFDISGLDVDNLESATLTVASNRTKAGNHHIDVSYINDDCLDNIGWDERSLTWNNAPGNDTASLSGLDTTKTTFLTTINYSDVVAGDSFTIDVLEALETDTDGIVQFVFHNSNNLQDLATHDHAEEAWRPFISATEGAKNQARKSYPAKGATDVVRDVVLSWTPGEFASSIDGHKVYFSENFSDVNAGIGAITQSAASYAPGRLEFETTYYWRVDEVNSPPDSTVYEGNVWSFTTEPVAYVIQNITAMASSSDTAKGPENTVNGSGLDESGLLHGIVAEDNMWLSSITGPQPTWIEFQFDKVYKLYQMWVWNSNGSLEPAIGLGFKDVSVEYSVNGTDYTTLGTTHEFTRAPGAPDYAHNTIVDLSGVAAKYLRLTANSNWGGLLNQYGLSEVRFFYIPVWAREPDPDSGAINVDLDVLLRWRAGREAVTHDVYLSTDEQAVIDGNTPVATVTEVSYGPLDLDLGQTYYWRVDEVNEAETPTTWESDVWNLTTREFLIMDDFEAYNDLNPEDPESNRIFNVWIDGYEQPTNGSLVGYENAPFCEQTIVHGGRQSMPFFYANTGGAAYSEAERTFAIAQNWTVSGVQTLVLYFHGTDGNTGQLYVKANGTKVVYGGDAADTAKPQWQQWNIDLASLGVNLQNITKLSIGIDGNGASGTLYVDDIRLYRTAPELEAP